MDGIAGALLGRSMHGGTLGNVVFGLDLFLHATPLADGTMRGNPEPRPLTENELKLQQDLQNPKYFSNTKQQQIQHFNSHEQYPSISQGSATGFNRNDISMWNPALEKK